MAEFTKPKCRLIGADGNVFNVIMLVCNALKESGMEKEAEEFKTKAINSKSYDEVLQLSMEYVNVE